MHDLAPIVAQLGEPLVVVDVGAQALTHEGHVYDVLRRLGVPLRVIGFEPQADRAAARRAIDGDDSQIIEAFIGDGGTHRFHPASSCASSSLFPLDGDVCATVASLSGISSLYAPIQRQNVELKLHIKPQINQGDTIRLEVEEQTEEIASVDKTLGPTTSKRSTKTTVIAQDQTTVVLGGLMQERTVRSVQKVPILGSIPILGRLFRSEETKKTKTNLLLFLTPYIIRDPSDYRRIFERKLAERAEFQKQFQGGEQGTVDYSKKPGLLERIDRGVQDELKRAENGGTGAADERVVLAR